MFEIPLLVFISIALAYTVLGITGFGSALIAVPLLLQWMPLGEAVPLVLWLDVMALVVFNSLNLKHIDWPIWKQMLPSIVVGIVSAALAVRFFKLPAHWLLLALGAYIIWFGASKLRAEFKPAAQKPMSKTRGFWSISPFGWMAGVIETLFGTCGPIVATGILRQSSNMSLFKATMSAVMLPAALLALSTYAVSGGRTDSEVWRALWLTPSAIFFVWLGNRLGKQVPQQTARRIVFGMLLISGFVLMAKALRHLAI
jgi:uncharacterized protein